ncbi:hypothetical protein [Piscirickettsia salmonis]|nr:hypothetical protein [Piscirickettsia salmonis]
MLSTPWLAAMVNILAGLAAYCLQEKKPSLNIQRNLLTSRAISNSHYNR